MSKIQCKVVKIINEHLIVINAGANKGLRKGRKLEIYVPGEPIVDPETNESLGTLDLIKATIVVKDLFEKMSVCENDDSITKSTFSALIALQGTSYPKNFKVDPLDITGGYSDKDRTIRVGDLVREVL